MSNKKFKIGDKVKYVGENYFDFPNLFPTKGTFGILVNMDGEDCEVTWEDKNIGADGSWYVPICDIEKVEKEDTTNEEVWEMLKSKMEKNKLKPMGTCTKWNGCVPEYFYTYSEDDVHNAIAIAYHSGYERAMKGRPFKFGEKKKGGHWESVDPNNLPKEGTKVRYSRKCKDYSDSDEYICINDTGTIKLEGSWFGMTLDNPHRYRWICFDDAENCLDMWVEDDE